MKKNQSNNLLKFFIILNIVFIFLQIHKQTYLVKRFYEKQHLEKDKLILIDQKNNLVQKFYEMKKPENILNFATKKLNLQKIKLNQISKINLNESNL